MKGNSYGNFRSTRERIMAEHDALPAELRFLSCNTVANWSPETFQSNYDHARDYGPAHPESPASDRS